MARKLRIAAVLVLAMAVSGCTGMRAEEYAGTQPELVLEEYFSVPVRAWGVVQDRSGKVTRRFSVDMRGEQRGDLFLLHEAFAFADGERSERTWQLRRLDAHRYEGTAADVVGSARIEAYGSAVNLDYTLRLPVGERTWEIDFDDWLFLQEDGVLINRATMRKFGFRVGELTVVFQRQG